MADTIKIGNLDISAFKVGSDDCKVYLGDTLLYPTTPPTPTFDGKWLATYSGGTTASAECGSSSAITQNEVTKNDLVSLQIGNCVTGFSIAAFEACLSLSSVTISDSVTTIDEATFLDCSGLTTCTLGTGVTTIGDSAFAHCTGLTSITIPDSVTYIDDWAFEYCHSLTYAIIKSGSIGKWVFGNCSGLTSVTIGSGVTSIGDYAFYRCSGLTSITVEATTPPTLGDYVFDYTNNCPIYVPAASLSAFQSAWGSYSSRIQSLPNS